MPRPVETDAAPSGAGFVHTFLPGRVVFGAGSLDRVATEVEALGVRRTLVIATNSARAAADAVEAQLGDLFAGRIDGVAQHVPTELAEGARAKAREAGADAVVAIGGGSAIGLAKAIALTTERVVIVAVPTTYAGSEMTPVWGETTDGHKSTGTDLRVLPRVVVYDPVLSRELPLKVTAASVANAIAHCVEAVWTPKADPITELTAVEGLRALSSGLRDVLLVPDDLDARSNLLYGACLAGSALATAGTGLHHKLCHLLGGTYNLPHAETHAAVLPQVARVNASSVPEAKTRLKAALGTTDLAGGLFHLFQDAGVPTSLRELGLTEEQVAEAAAAFKPTDNPIPATEDLVRDILTRAWSGTRP
ncbi:maleylacetate reductase [Kribbella sp. VKM Ac-2569]|uniref:maleylacetate reductase n=1 Tax=Kribbella sp. VKM Ac-2569 TaxID=2512220 RepID=UPI00102B95C4|nr:maleylacetate reductase [Kribbella sp. VKM Ac-2569]RZT12754.1 maleylacetate reductase [Kribbella sp. VKM Ac-2569]